MSARRILPAAALALLAAAGQAAQVQTRTAQEGPAIVLAAFGTSGRAKATYDSLEADVRRAFPGVEVRWAFTSEIVREKVNAQAGAVAPVKSVRQALADLEAEGYRRVAVQPVQIVPGEEYQEVVESARGWPGLRVEVGEPLLGRWTSVRAVVERLAADFLSAGEGCNLVVGHGSPTTGSGANATYLGLERYLRTYPNALLGLVEGVIPKEESLRAAAACPGPRVRIVPLLWVAGEHVLRDLAGEQRGSWRQELERAGKTVDLPKVDRDGRAEYRGLGDLPELRALFVEELRRTLGRL